MWSSPTRRGRCWSIKTRSLPGTSGSNLNWRARPVTAARSERRSRYSGTDRSKCKKFPEAPGLRRRTTGGCISVSAQVRAWRKRLFVGPLANFRRLISRRRASCTRLRSLHESATYRASHAAAGASGKRASLFSLDNRYIAPAFITCILLAGHLSFGILESYQKTLLAIVTSIAFELVLGRIFFHKWLHPASAYISGISVGILVRSPAFWPYALCAAISITSKYVLRVKDRHIWNPSNFGISVLLFLAPETVATLSIQWGNYLLPMLVIWVLGSVIIARLHRFHITGIYVASFLAFAFLRSWMTGSPWQSEVAPITGPMYQLFIFFMITDPKTTVRSKRGQCIVVFLVALLEMVLRLRADRLRTVLCALYCGTGGHAG